ncbi:MAG: hypothetical protein MJ180_04900 [Candidatus Gastranaerophilales bacterium]|nr:hypothetical protein [Candidatus Gastranaerophilales bacterium]
MIPKDLDIEEFAKALSGQAGELFPPELPDALKQTVIQVVYNFIKIAGNALNGEAREYNQDETILVCQLVGEWMYHKGIDNYKNQIPQEYWEPILQQIAFAIFESAKNAVNEGKPQDDIITIAENAVNATYHDCLQQLANENKLAKSVDEMMNQSNLHDYVEENYKEEEVSPVQEEKDLKMMTMALFFKSLPPDEVGKLVKLLNEEQRRQIVTYIQMQDLEKLVDPVIYNKYLEKFNNFMPKVQQKKKRNSMFSRINKSFENIKENDLNILISKERKNVKNFLLRVYSGKIKEEDIFPMDLTNTIIDYTIQKVKTNENKEEKEQ